MDEARLELLALSCLHVPYELCALMVILEPVLEADFFKALAACDLVDSI